MNEAVKKALGTTVLPWLGGGAGFAVAWKLLSILESQPELLGEVMKSWGPLFGLGAIALFLIDRRAGQGIQHLDQNTSALADLAGAVKQIAEKDDRRGEATEAAFRYVAQNTERLMTGQGEMAKKIERITRKLGIEADE